LISQVEVLRATAFLGVVPTMLDSLAAAATRREGDHSSVRLILVGGESFHWETLEKARRAFSGASVIVNQYGPTEITMIAAHYQVPSSPDGRGSATVPIGRPIPNTQAYILDRNLQPVPIGVPGELVIGGVGLTRGYLHRPDLSAERFLPNPFTGAAGDRLYRTGDLARYLPDGNIEFLGRLDDQVKVRGYRVEPGEIEAALGRHPSVLQAAVTAVEDAERGVRLLAFVVPRLGHEARPSILREFLQGCLPDFMVPSSIAVLEAMPLTPNGKIDRRALPTDNPRRPDLRVGFVAPSTPIEISLAKIWCDLLGVERVGVHDNFFDLGGHSLLATRAIARMRDDLQVEVGLRQFFDAEPTIACMAGRIEALGRIAEAERTLDGPAAWSSLVPLQPAGARPPLYCVHWAGGHVIIYRDLARHLGPDQPVYGLQAVGLDGRQAPHTRLEDMAAHYIREVRRLQPAGPYYLAGASMGGKIAFEMAQQLQEQGDQVDLLALIDTTGDVEREALPVGERIQLHSANIRQLGWPGGAGYLVHRARVRLRRWIYRIMIGMGWPIPRFMRNLRGISYVAARNYHPRNYPGKVTLFRAAERPLGGARDFFLGWDRVAGGGMEVFGIPGDHVSLMMEPGVRLLAEELKHCLSRRSAKGSGL